MIAAVLAIGLYYMNPERFRYFLRVRYGECDAQKVVFNARYARLCRSRCR